MNSKNLIPQNKRTKDEQREIAQKGGKISGQVRAKNKSIKEALQAMLQGNYEVDGEQFTGYDLIALSLFEKAKTGDVPAFNSLRDTVGERPVETVINCEVKKIEEYEE